VIGAAGDTIGLHLPQLAGKSVNEFYLPPASGKACHAVGPVKKRLGLLSKKGVSRVPAYKGSKHARHLVVSVLLLGEINSLRGANLTNGSGALRE
jgi:hypothetical protein